MDKCISLYGDKFWSWQSSMPAELTFHDKDNYSQQHLGLEYILIKDRTHPKLNFKIVDEKKYLEFLLRYS